MERNLLQTKASFSRCLHCMTALPRTGAVCPRCGELNGRLFNQPHQLPVGTLLGGRYLIGTVLGQGGFGITYIGWDRQTASKVAVKEYFPEGCVSRSPEDGHTLLPIYGERQQIFETGKQRFSEEARALMRFSGDPCIVSIRAFLLENDTAYIVMEYVDGPTLKQAVRDAGGKMPSRRVLTMLKPIMASLYSVHRAGLIHRDISPDNILLRGDGSAVLIDFGAARAISASGERSNTVNVKHGYAPEEQYRKHGEQGPWTDVYALCATIYRLTTGRKPVQALERLAGEDTLEPPNRLGADFSASQQRALMKGLSVHAADRQQDMRALSRELCTDLGRTREQRQGGGLRFTPGKRRNRLLFLSACAMLLLAGTFVLLKTTKKSVMENDGVYGASASPDESPLITQTAPALAATPIPAAKTPVLILSPTPEQTEWSPPVVPELPEIATGVVTGTEANLRTAPDYSCQVIRKLEKGDALEVYYLQSGFYYVKDKDTEEEGFVHQSLLKVDGVFDNRGGEEPTPTPRETPVLTPNPQSAGAATLSDVKYVASMDGDADENGLVNRFGYMSFEVHNAGEKTVSEIGIRYLCYDEDGKIIGTGEDRVIASLAPGASAKHNSENRYYITGQAVKVTVKIASVRYQDGTSQTEDLPSKTVKLT